MSRISWSTQWLGFVLVILACLGLAGLEIYGGLANGPQMQQGRANVVRAFETIDAAQALAGAVQDAERGQRGYLLTGNPFYLEPYSTGSQKAPPLVDKLRHLTADNPEQSKRVAAIDADTKIKLAELAHTIDVRRSQGFDAALQVVETDEGLDAMRRITTGIESIISAEHDLLQARLAQAERDERGTATIGWVSAAVALVIFALGLIAVRRSVQSVRFAEAAQQESQEHLALLVKSVTEYAMYTLDTEGRLTSWNSGAERLKGYSESEVVGQHFSVFFTPEDRDKDVPRLALQTAAAKGYYEAESWHVRKDGSLFMANTIIDPLRDASGKLIGFAKITRDITERVRQADALEKAREALAQSQKMDALGQLTGGIAHDFNNLLHVIIGSIEALQRRLKTANPDLVRFAEAAARSAERAASLTQQLLAFTRRQPLNPQPIDANKLVTGMSDLLRRTLGETIAIETVLAGGLWRASADVNQLESAIINLGVNARDAMPEGGKLTIETANTHLDQSYDLSQAELAPGQYIMIAVSDTGTGMDSDTLGKAFEPFFTTKEVGHGTGLGLSQVYGFIKQSGGHVKLYSEPGHGTTVKLYLPRLAGEVTADAVADGAAPDAGGNKETILLVEDDAEVRALTTELLRELGYRVIAAGDAHEVRRMLPQARFDLLFTDVGLPGGVNGRQLAEEARKRWPHIKVLFTSGYARNAIIHHGRLDPGVALVPKPFSQHAVAEKIRQVLDAD